MHYSTNRKVSTSIKNVTMTCFPSKGTPQGGILSPFIWNFVLDGLLVQFTEGPCKAIGFADDICLLSSGPVENAIVDKTAIH